MITYILQVSTAWCIFILIYQLLLRQEKYFVLNRWYLLGSLLGGLLLPLISMIPFGVSKEVYVLIPEISSAYYSQLEYMSILSTTEIINQKSSAGLRWAWSDILFTVYYFGLLVMLLKGIASSTKLASLIVKGKRIKFPEYTELSFESGQLPFSFFNYICIGNLTQDKQVRDNILQHELYHVKAFHSIDVLLVEVLHILFWWNPLIYIYKRAITENHEFAADAKVLECYSRKVYCQLLMKTTFPNVDLQLSNPFFQSFIKKRIHMMYQKESKRSHLLKYGFSLLTFVFLIVLFAGPLRGQEVKWNKIATMANLNLGSKIKKETIKLTVNNIELEEGEDYLVNEELGKVYIINNELLDKDTPIKVDFAEDTSKVNDHIEIFTNLGGCTKNNKGIYFSTQFSRVSPISIVGCDENMTSDERPSCASSLLHNYANTNKKYPEQAISEGYQGMVMYSLIIDKNGEIVDVTLPLDQKRYIHGIKEDGLRLIEEIKKEFTFIPASCQGTNVKSKITLSYSYMLAEEDMPLVKVKDSKTASNLNQIITLNHISQKGMSFEYRSDMNVPSTISITNPDGKEIFQKTIPYMYKSFRDYIELENPINGSYTIKVIQDGIETSSTINVNVFK